MVGALTIAAAASFLSQTALADAPSDTLSWPALLDRLGNHTTTAQFTASRNPPEESQAQWTYDLDFPIHPHADFYALLITLADTLHPHQKHDLTVDDTPTRTVLTLTADDAHMSLVVPRLSNFQPTVTIRFLRDEPDATFPRDQVDALIRAYQMCQAGVSSVTSSAPPLLPGHDSVDTGPSTALDHSRTPNQTIERNRIKRAKEKLQEMGVEVFDGDIELTWDALAGYDDVKKRIDDTLTLPLKHPDVYEGIVRGTRKRFESNLPKAVLYEGPPGCGKTLSAKILAASIGIPFVHVPLETILSKFYGETTRKLADILTTANELGRCLLFIDECDSIGLSRSSSTDIHEVTRRTLSVLLRFIDGMDGPQNTILLAATNHKEDIDPALMSRFDVVVSFPLPGVDTRIAVLKLYAKHLTEEELREMAESSCGFSGRELLDVCEEAERIWGGVIVRGGAEAENKLPRLREYVEAIRRKRPHVVGNRRNDREVELGQLPSVEA